MAKGDAGGMSQFGGNAYNGFFRPAPSMGMGAGMGVSNSQIGPMKQPGQMGGSFGGMNPGQSGIAPSGMMPNMMQGGAALGGGLNTGVAQQAGNSMQVNNPEQGMPRSMDQSSAIAPDMQALLAQLFQGQPVRRTL